MKTKFIKIFLFLTITILLTNCATQRTSNIVGGEYNETKNVTDYFVLPYGSVILPGKWNKTNYNKISRQQFFKNNDSVSIAIAFERFDNYEFNNDGSKKGYEFVKEFYNWDSNYFVERYGMNRQLLESDSTNNFILYRIYGLIENSNFDTYFLIGEKNGNTSNFSISITDKWSKNKKIDFLKKIFITEEE